ncbi:PA1571 family protein [Pseudomonas psychrophila]|uniref:PA1571 family protein n=1 Tax=Pseudomonas psychrophila TaxID=122355 RepID=UPI0002EA433B|nr:PA1571 family protein [Pseudomonas psychrophila]
MDLQHNAQAVPVIRTQPQASLGCAFIDAEGKEVLITEEMIQNACHELEERLVKPAHKD